MTCIHWRNTTENMEIKIVIGQGSSAVEYTLLADKSVSFTAAMRQLGLAFHAPCGGKGRCLKCGIRFLYGSSVVTDADTEAYERRELNNGYRLGCQAILTRDCKIEIPSHMVDQVDSADVARMEGLADFGQNKFALAVDVGSTTLAMAAVDVTTGQILAQGTRTNSQTAFGADVMTRIDAANHGQDKDLQQAVRQDLRDMALELVGPIKADYKVVAAGNTTMVHLAMDYPAQGLAQAPFVPYTLEALDFVERSKQVHVMPGISAFVGGDIVSGLYYLDLPAKEGPSLFIDMGTNAELVLFDGKTYYCASAAAGPALEGGNLSQGLASVKGAINHAYIEDGKCIYSTIANAPAQGICGSGAIDLVYQLRKEGIIDAGGLLSDEYSQKGYPVTEDIFLTGEDIQQILLAKSAIRSGIDLLLSQAGLSASDVAHLYVAGGLGAAARAESVAKIGIIPAELEDKYQAVGNTSLQGTIKYILSPNQEAIDAIIATAQTVELGGNSLFEEKFLENLYL